MEERFILRVWSESHSSWKASLKNLDSKETQFFADKDSFKRHFEVADVIKEQSTGSLSNLERLVFELQSRLKHEACVTIIKTEDGYELQNKGDELKGPSE